MNLVSSFEVLLQQLAFVMTIPTFTSFVTLLTGWVFSSRRNITGMICAAGAVRTKHHSAYHRVFAAARWSLDALGLAVFDLVLPWIDDAVVLLAIDDTLARKRGLKIFGVGMHHDPLISTRKTALTNWGHSWVVLGVMVRFPFCSKRCFCLPMLFRLYINKQTAAQQGIPYRTRPELALAMLQVLCQAHAHRRFHVVGDSAYGGQNVLKHLPSNCDLTSRLDLDARLYEAPPQRKAGKNGRPRKRGKRLPTPRQMLKGRTRRLSLKIYGRRDRSRVADGVARVHAVPDRPLRIVVVKPLTGGRRMQAFYSTRQEASAKAVLTWYAMRWSIEEANQNSKTHLGFEESQNWSRKAVQRTAPVAMLLHSLIVVWFASEGHRYYSVPDRPWYRAKSHASFADMLATLRCRSIREKVFSMGLSGQGSRKVIETLEHAVRQAA
jgi:hypothetical protein